MMAKKLAVGLALLGGFAMVVALLGSSWPARGQTTGGLLFIQQDKIIRFNTTTGEGVQVGTATGRINGVSIVDFKVTEAATGLPDITFDNRVGITDLDGDQIIFHNVGTGRLVIPPLIDESAPLTNQVFGATPVLCPGFGGACSGVGGWLTGTYEVVATSGKYVDLFPIGQKFPYRAVAYDPSSPPAEPEDLGAAYVEVSATPIL